MAALRIVCAMLVCALVAAPMTNAAMSCSTVASSLAQCLNYLKGTGPLTPQCCGGVTSLNNNAKTTQDRQTACTCLKNLAGTYKGIVPGNAESLPGKCKVNIPYKISTSTNCKSIK